MFARFSKADLQRIVEAGFPGLLQRLGTLLPLLSTESELSDLGNKRILIRLASSFFASDFLRDVSIRKQILSRLPADELKEVASAAGVSLQGPSFVSHVEALLRLPWLQLARALSVAAGLDPRFAAPTSPDAPPIEAVAIPRPDRPVLISTPFKTLLDYQHNIFVQARALARIPRNRFIIQMPTGSGKTRTVMELINEAFDESPHSDSLVVWIAHSSELCNQAIDCFRETRVHVGKKDVHLCRYWGSGGADVLPEGPALIVTTYQKLCSLRRRSKGLEPLRKRAILAIVDEAHVAVAQKFGAAVSEVLGDRCTLIGLTATPVREQDGGTAKLQETFLGNLVSIASAQDNAFEELMAKGILARPRFQFVESESTFNLTASEFSAIEKELDFPDGFLRKVGADDLRNALILKEVQAHARLGRSVILFGCSVAHSRFLASTLLYMGISAAHVDGESDMGVRTSIVEEFRSRRLRVLCNFGLLTTGFDAPTTDVVFITRPTASPVLYAQMVGRGLRGPKLGGKSVCHVTGIRDNFGAHGSLIGLYQRFKEEWLPS